MTTFLLPDLGRLLGRPAPATRRRRGRTPDWIDGRAHLAVDDGTEPFDWFTSSAELARGLDVIETPLEALQGRVLEAMRATVRPSSITASA